MAISYLEHLQIVYSDNSNKYNLEKEAKDEYLSTIDFVNSFRNSCCIFLTFNACRCSESKLRCAAMAISYSEHLQIVYSDTSNKYNIEKEAKDE